MSYVSYAIINQSKIIIKYIHIKVLHFITVQSRYVGFISKCNDIIGVDAIRLPVPFEDCKGHSIWWSIIIPRG